MIFSNLLKNKRFSIIVLSILGQIGAITSNTIFSIFPDEWKPFFWLSLPITVVLIGIEILLTINQSNELEYQNNIKGKEVKRYRETIIDRIESIWINGVLKNSLINRIKIELSFVSQFDLPEKSWINNYPVTNADDKSTYSTLDFLKIVTRTNNSILILGEPGSGKSTELFKIAEKLIIIANKDDESLIPIIFNLSTWKPNLPVSEWIKKEMIESYRFSEKMVNYYLQKEKFIYMFDGLDEVGTNYRTTCAKSINEFLLKNTTPIIICCRTNDYVTFENKINVTKVFTIQPLSKKGILDYLGIVEKKLIPIYEKIHTLSQGSGETFLQTPLFLDIFLIAYSNATKKELDNFLKSGNLQKHLFDFYVKRMLDKKGKSEYPNNIVQKTLTWLARNLVNHNRSIFYIEDISETWLDPKNVRILSRIIRTIIIIPIFCIIFGLFFSIPPVLIDGVNSGIAVGKFLGIFLGSLLGLMIGMVGGISDYQKPTSELTWSTKGLKNGMIIGFSLGFLFFIANALTNNSRYGLIYGSAVFLELILFSSFQQKEVCTHFRPDQSIINSFRNFMKMFFFFSVLFVSFVLITGGFTGSGISVGLFLSVFIGSLYGGGFLLVYLMHRIQLFILEQIPFRLINFLNFVSDRVLLIRLEGGYSFMHRLLLEYFLEEKWKK